MDTILDVIGISTKVRLEPGSLDYVRRSMSSNNSVACNLSNDTDDEVEMGVDVVSGMQ